MWIEDNPNPAHRDIGDCAVRAVSLATGDSWEDVYLKLCMRGALCKDMPNANSVWGSYLMDNGWTYHPLDRVFSYTVGDFCREHDTGVFVIGTGDHAICIKDGNIHDTWDSSSKIPLYYFSMD